MLSFAFRTDTAEDLRASRAFGRYASSKGQAYLKLSVTLLILAVVLVWQFRSSGEFPWLTVLVPILIVLALFAVPLIINRMRAARMGSDVPDQKRIISDAGLEVRNARISHWPWARITQVSETPEFFLFFVNSAGGHYLPKRAIQSVHELEQVRAELRRNVGSRFVDQTSVGRLTRA